MIERRFLFALAVLLSLVGIAAPASAQLSFSLRTGDDLTKRQSMAIDSNQCPAKGPLAAFVGGVVTNGGTQATNIVATMSGLGAGFTLAGGQAAAQSIGALAPGASAGVYWFVGYGCTDLASASPIISLTSNFAASTTLVALTGRSSISANAGGNVSSSTLGPGAVVGQTIFFDAAYDFGGSVVGDEFLLQPSGGQAFNAACFRLVGAQITGSNVAAIATGTMNRLYFKQTAQQSGNGYFVRVRYFFEYQCGGASTTARPYAVQTSGNTNLKYTGNFDGTGSIAIAFPGATNPFTISKTSNIASTPGGVGANVQYTVTVGNPSAFASRISRFVDTLPAGASFVGLAAGSGVTIANSSSVPATGATGTLIFAGKPDVSYLIPAGGSVALVYTVRMPAKQGAYVNSAQAFFGGASTPTATRTFTVTAPPPLTVVKSSTAYSDPINGTANPKLIPGGRVSYTITVSNPNGYAVDNNSVVVIDATPLRLRLFVGDAGGAGSGPIIYSGGVPAPGLSYTYVGVASTSDDLDFSADGGASWTYVPTAGASGTDPAVTHFRVRPQGAMAAGTSFTLRFGYLID